MNIFDFCVLGNFELYFTNFCPNSFPLVIFWNWWLTNLPSTLNSLLMKHFSTVNYHLQLSLHILLTNHNYHQHALNILSKCHFSYCYVQASTEIHNWLNWWLCLPIFQHPLVHKIFWNLICDDKHHRRMKCRCIFKIKCNGVHRAWLIACWYSQLLGVNLSENYFLIVNNISFRILLLILIKWSLDQNSQFWNSLSL